MTFISATSNYVVNNMQYQLFRYPTWLVWLIAVSALPLVAQYRIVNQGILDEGNTQTPQVSSPDYLDYSRRGEVGVVYLDVEKSERGYYHRLRYCRIMQDQLPEPPQVIYNKKVYRQRVAMAWSLAFDASSRPHIVCQHHRDYLHYYRQGNHWQCQQLCQLLSQELSLKITWITHYKLVLGQDGRLHLFLQAHAGRGRRAFVYGIWDNHWKFTELKHISDQIFGAAIERSGKIHLAYEVDRHLYYATNQGKSWKQEPVALRDNFDSEPAWNASLAIDRRGKPFIAATFIQRGGGGSFRFAQLRLHSRHAGKWSTKVIAARCAGYYGRDGKQYTGISPYLAIDDNGRKHIIFTDMASWHGSEGNDYASGQLRYCWHDKNGWQTQIVYKQVGQAQKARPISEFWHPALALSADGSKLYIAGLERTTFSSVNRYNPDAIRYYRLLGITVESSSSTNNREFHK